MADLAGKAAGGGPGTPLQRRATVASVVDRDTKRRDVYAVRLEAGQALRVDVTGPGRGFATVALVPRGVASVACVATAPIAAPRTYYLVVRAQEPGVRYTLRATAPWRARSRGEGAPSVSR